MTSPPERRRRLPPGGQVAALAMADGWPVRTALWRTRRPARGSILLVTGRADFIEKYLETMHDWLDAGWNVASFDWRGQGGSGRVGRTPLHGDCPGYDLWGRDLARIIGWFRAGLPGPHMAVAHSMGGHLLLRHLAGGTGDAGIDRAVLLAPMCGLAPRPPGLWLARRLAWAATATGQGGAFVAGAGPPVDGPPGSTRQRLLTADPDRYADEGWWRSQNPALALGGVTWRWLDAAFAACDALAAAAPLRIEVPLIALLAEDEQLVCNAAAQALLPGRCEVIPGAAHELLREADAVRGQVLARIDAFLGHRA